LKKAASFVGVIFILLFCACGEMGSIIPLSRIYQVSAMVESYSLDEYALIKQDEKIRPFFVQSIRNDPDIISLVITLKAADGTQAQQISYVLDTAEDTDNLDDTQDDKSDDNDDKYDIDEDDIEDPEEDSIIVIPMEGMGGTFPHFTMPLNLEPGPYVMVFEVFGKKEALISKTEKNFYYLAEEDYDLADISVHLPGIITPPHLIPPGTVVLLNAEIQSGEALDPYIAWYNGKTCIGEGKVSEGANRLLWKLPAHTSFQNIRAEVIPFPPLPSNQRSVTAARPDRLLLGKSRAISLAVSSAGEFTGILSDLLENIETNHQGIVLRDYQFAGNLNDSMNPLPFNTLRRTVNPESNEENPIRWLPAKEFYGLGIGPDDMYEHPPFSLEPQNKQLSFVLYFTAINQGTLFSVAFEDPAVNFSFLRGEEGFLLSSIIENQEEQFDLEIPLNVDIHTLLLDFSLEEESLLFALKDAHNLKPYKEITIELPDSKEIRGLFSLGGNEGSYPVMILQGLSMVSLPPLADG
jgi:hypothetical protein